MSRSASEVTRGVSTARRVPLREPDGPAFEMPPDLIPKVRQPRADLVPRNDREAENSVLGQVLTRFAAHGRQAPHDRRESIRVQEGPGQGHLRVGANEEVLAIERDPLDLIDFLSWEASVDA